MRIGILTGGGDVPGLNPCIRALVYRAIDEGHEVLGIRRGWEGLLHYNPEYPACEAEYILPLDKVNTRTIHRTGGTILHTSRVNPRNVRAKDVPEFLRGSDFDIRSTEKSDYTWHVLKILETLGIDILVPIGGDDTLSYGARLFEENFPIVAIPKTMDNDVFGTDYCIGFSTAITRTVNFIHQLRSTSGSHERLAVIELFGRNCGESCLISSYLAGVDRAIISEVPFDAQKLTDLLVEDQGKNPSRYAIVAISEGAQFIEGEIIESGEEDAYGHKRLGGIGMATAEAIKKIGEYDIIFCGRQEADWDAGQVGSGVAEILGIPSVTAIKKIEVSDGKATVERVLADGYETIEVPLPMLVTVSNEIGEPRYATLKGIMAAAKKQVTNWSSADVTPAQARSQMLKIYIPVHEGECEFIEGETAEEAGTNLAAKLREAKLI